MVRRPLRAAGVMLLCGLLACSPASEAPGNAPAPDAAAQDGSPPPFPALDPFEASRMWQVFAADAGPRRQRAELEKLRAMAGELEPADGAEEGEPTADALPGAPSARMRRRYFVVPMLVASLRATWGKDSWEEAELALVRETLDYLHETVGSPKLTFGADQGRNRAELARFAAWFAGEVRKPAVAGAMILTFDDGPYRGLDDPAERAPLETPQRRAFGTGLELRLGEVQGNWVLRCAREGTVLWSRVLSVGGRPVMGNVTLLDSEPVGLGDFGWKLHLQVGGEYSHLYVTPAGDLLFYFVSW